MKINKVQKMIIVAYVVIIFFLCIVSVPWCSKVQTEGINIRNTCGYAPIWSKPKSCYGHEVDMTRLIIEIFALSLVSGTAFVLARHTNKEGFIFGASVDTTRLLKERLIMKLNKVQKLIILSYAMVVFSLCFLFVPWCKGVISYRYSPIWIPPEDRCQVDFKRLLLGIFAFSVGSGTVFLLTGDKKDS